MSDQPPHQSEYVEPSAETRRLDESVIRRELGAKAHIAYTDEGWDSRVYVVNDGEAVFKFPRTSNASRQYEREIAALRLLETIKSPVETPHVKWQGSDLSYFGYEGITGEPLGCRVAQLSDIEKVRVGSDLGEFLHGLHAAELPGTPRTDITTKIGEYREKYSLAKPALVQAFSEAEVRTIEHFLFVDLADGLQRLGNEMKLCHGDLGPWNILVTPDGNVGVIDLGDVGYQDPAVDFSGFGNETILQAAFEVYGANDRLREDAVLRSRALPILDIPFYAGKHDQHGLERCIDLVRRVIIENQKLRDARFTRE